MITGEVKYKCRKNKHFLAGLILLTGSLGAGTAQAEQLIVYSIHRPEHFIHNQANSWQALHRPPKRADNIQLSNRGKLIYEMNQDKDWDGFELDPKTGASRLIAKSSWFKSGFLSVMPQQRSDGSYYA